MTGAVSPAPKYNLKEAEQKLAFYEDDAASTDVQLRRAFLQPQGMFAEDVFVRQEMCLKRGKGIESRQKLASEVMQGCVDTIGRRYSANSEDEAKLILNLYLCDVTTGNREGRIYASETGIGHVRLTLAWVLALKDGSVVLDGGRMNEEDGHMFGFGDIVRVANPERTLRNMASRMCAKILARTNIKSRMNMCGCDTG